MECEAVSGEPGRYNVAVGAAGRVDDGDRVRGPLGDPVPGAPRWREIKWCQDALRRLLEQRGTFGGDVVPALEATVGAAAQRGPQATVQGAAEREAAPGEERRQPVGAEV